MRISQMSVLGTRAQAACSKALFFCLFFFCCWKYLCKSCFSPKKSQGLMMTQIIFMFKKNSQCYIHISTANVQFLFFCYLRTAWRCLSGFLRIFITSTAIILKHKWYSVQEPKPIRIISFQILLIMVASSKRYQLLRFRLLRLMYILHFMHACAVVGRCWLVVGCNQSQPERYFFHLLLPQG